MNSFISPGSTPPPSFIPKQNFTENHTKIFVSKIPSSIKQAEIHTFCENFGQVVNCTFSPSPGPAGHFIAHVSFMNSDDAANALSHINKLRSAENPMRATYFREYHNASASDRELEVRQMPENFGEEDLATLFSTYGALSAAHIAGQTPAARVGRVAFLDPSCANQAMAELKDFRPNENSEQLLITFAKRNPRPSPASKPRSQQPNSKTILVTNIPSAWDERILHNLFANFGGIAALKIDFNLQLQKKAALVTLLSAAQATAAFERINGVEVDEKKSRLALRLVSESLPPRSAAARGSCVYFGRGYCFRGESCWFDHSAPAAGGGAPAKPAQLSFSTGRK